MAPAVNVIAARQAVRAELAQGVGPGGAGHGESINRPKTKHSRRVWSFIKLAKSMKLIAFTQLLSKRSQIILTPTITWAY